MDFYLYRTYLYVATNSSPVPLGSYSAPSTGIYLPRWDTGGGQSDGYIMNSASPMEAYFNAGGAISNGDLDYCIRMVYDPTNGTVSFGNIWRSGGVVVNHDSIFGAVQSSQ